jgi:hypothetical protein
MIVDLIFKAGIAFGAEVRLPLLHDRLSVRHDLALTAPEIAQMRSVRRTARSAVRRGWKRYAGRAPACYPDFRHDGPPARPRNSSPQRCRLGRDPGGGDVAPVLHREEPGRYPDNGCGVDLPTTDGCQNACRLPPARTASAKRSCPLWPQPLKDRQRLLERLANTARSGVFFRASVRRKALLNARFRVRALLRVLVRSLYPRRRLET